MIRTTPTREQNPLGFHTHYQIRHADGTPVDADAVYFVMRLDDGGKDKKHVEACRDGILKYADKIKDHLPVLASELRSIVMLARYKTLENECRQKTGHLINAHGQCQWCHKEREQLTIEATIMAMKKIASIIELAVDSAQLQLDKM